MHVFLRGVLSVLERERGGRGLPGQGLSIGWVGGLCPMMVQDSVRQSLPGRVVANAWNSVASRREERSECVQVPLAAHCENVQPAFLVFGPPESISLNSLLSTDGTRHGKPRSTGKD